MLSAWRESPLYSPAERAALALCEAMTLIASATEPGHYTPGMFG